MAAADKSRVSMDDAVGLIGEAIFHADWIGSLTERESWLIKHYIGGSNSIRPGDITYTIAGRAWALYPADPVLVAEVERAIDRRDWAENQCDRVLCWLEDHGFDIDAASIAKEVLELKMARGFTPQAAGPTMTAPRAQSIRPPTQKLVEIAKEYIAAQNLAGIAPTSAGFEVYARKIRPRVGRDRLRAAFRKERGDDFKGRGRPRKSPK